MKIKLFQYQLFSVFSIILFYFVFLDESIDNFIVNASSENFPLNSNFFVYLLLFAQMIFAPIQAGFSDFFCRKKSLVFSIGITFLSVIFIKLASHSFAWIFVLAVLLKGMFGNTLPIAWAGISDVTPDGHRNIRFALGVSICAMAVGSWLTLLLITKLSFIGLFIFSILIALVGIILAVNLLKDKRDYDVKPKHKEKSILNFLMLEYRGFVDILQKPITLLAMASFFFSEISMYQIIFRIELYAGQGGLLWIPLATAIGYTIGTVLIKLLKYNDKICSALGCLIALFCSLLASFLGIMGILSPSLIGIIYSFYAFGFAIYTPSLFSMISHENITHNQGKIYGLLESYDCLASLVVFAIIYGLGKVSAATVFHISSVALIICLIFLLNTFKCKFTNLH